MENEEKNLITITDEDGNTVDCEFLDTVETDGKLYCVLAPIGDSEEYEEGSCYIFRVANDGSEETWDLVPVEDEAELNAAFEKFLENNSEEGCSGDCSGCAGCDSEK